MDREDSGHGEKPGRAILQVDAEDAEPADYLRAIEDGETALHVYLKDDKEWWLAHNEGGEYPGNLNGPWLFWHTYPSGPREVDFCTREVLAHHVEELYYVDSDGEATIYYRSPQSDEMQHVTINVQYMEGRAGEITGKEVGTGRRIEALTRWERDIVSKHGTDERTLGKVTRVEFPRGHRFTVEVEGIGDSKGGEQGEKRIKDRVEGAFGSNGVSVEVSHEGELEWE